MTAAATMRLWYAETLCPRKACAVAGVVGSPLTMIRVDLAGGEQRTPGYLAINPNGKVPALEDGALRLWESNAIMCHLAQRAGSPLWPLDGAGQIEIVRWFAWDAEHFTRHGGELYFQFLIRKRFGLGEPDQEAVDAALTGFRASASVLDAHLGRNDWLLGSRMTVADFAVAAALPYAAEAQIPLDEFANVARWHSRLCDLPAWRHPFPQQAEAA